MAGFGSGGPTKIERFEVWRERNNKDMFLYGTIDNVVHDGRYLVSLRLQPNKDIPSSAADPLFSFERYFLKAMPEKIPAEDFALNDVVCVVGGGCNNRQFTIERLANYTTGEVYGARKFVDTFPGVT
jgi:hypothetical protein